MFRIFLALILLLISTPSFSLVRNGDPLPNIALWQKNGLVINDSQGKSVRENARIVCLDDNSTLVVWEDQRNGSTDIYAQRLDKNGAKLWGKNGIGVCEAAGSQTKEQQIHQPHDDDLPPIGPGANLPPDHRVVPHAARRRGRGEGGRRRNRLVRHCSHGQ